MELLWFLFFTGPFDFNTSKQLFIKIYPYNMINNNNLVPHQEFSAEVNIFFQRGLHYMPNKLLSHAPLINFLKLISLVKHVYTIVTDNTCI